MDPILLDIYSTILPSMPYIIGTYAAIWIVLFAYVAFIVRGIKKSEREITMLEEALKMKGISKEETAEN